MSISASCTKCVKLLQQVLEKEDSRPMSILQSMGGSLQSSTKTGVTLEIPKQESAILRRWSKLHPPDIAGSVEKTPTVNMPIATSAVRQKETLSIACRPCSDSGVESGARAFVMGPAPLSVVVCSNRLNLQDSSEMEQVLTHELIHVFDVRVQKLDLRSCETLAYSEVRAAREAECQNAWLANRYCIPQKALTATSNLFPPHQAKACVAKVFEKAMANPLPFKPVQKQSSWGGGIRQSER